jgi:hypothetical protein
MLLLGGVLALFSFAFMMYRNRNSVVIDPKQPAIKSLAVLPLKNLSGDPAQEYLADGENGRPAEAIPELENRLADEP